MGPWSPLHCAAYRHDTAMMRLLLNHRADMDVHTAAALASLEDIARLLDAEPHRVLERGGDGCQPLHFADTVDVAKLLLERGADIDARCIDHHSTPLQYLCTIRAEVARYLLSRGATPDVFSTILCGDDDGLEQLLAADSDSLRARIGQSYFPPGEQSIVHNILTFTVGMDSTTLHAAAKANRAEAIAKLIHRGLSPDVRGGYDQATPLHVAAWNNCEVAASALLDLGADIEAKSGKIHNNTPAGWAIVAGSLNVFELLVRRGAQVHPWFLDDARDACAGRFDQVSQSTAQQRQRILELIVNA